MYFNCKAQTSISVLPLFIIVALSGDGRDHQLKHIRVNVMNEYTIINSVVLIGKSINEH
jgi:hypothetical protein